MACGKLAVEQRGIAPAHRRDQPGKRHLRGIALPAEHALAAEHAPESHAVQSADKLALARFVARPGFDRMGVAERVQRAIAVADALRDPAVVRAGTRRRAAIDHRIERCVACHGKMPAPQRPRQRARTMKAVEGQDRPQSRLHPVDFRVVAAVRHRKDSRAIGPQQEVGRDEGGGRLQHHGENLHPPVALSASTH